MELTSLIKTDFNVKRYYFMYDFLLNTSNKIEKIEKISLLDNKKIEYYYNFVINLVDDQNKMELSLFQEKVKIIYERIMQAFQSKSASYFIDERITNLRRIVNNIDNVDETYKTTVDIKRKRCIVNNLVSTKYDEYIANSNTLSELVVFSSTDFLKNKLNLSDEEIKLIKHKGDTNDPLENDSLFNFEIADIIQPSLNKEGKQTIIEVIKEEAENVKKSITSSKNDNNLAKINRTSLERTVEDDLNNEVFHLVKGMNKYARNFTNILENDNQTIKEIENIQQKDKGKTVKQLKKLNEFQYKLQIGWIQLIIMFAFVLVSFIITLITIRIFPVLT